jgi:predicted RNA binding protein YcfA (HicA-like mRNA interferase family)
MPKRSTKRTNYARGAEIERRIIKELKDKGYIAVRTAGSHSPFDIISFNEKHTLLIQSKRTKKQINIDSVYKEELETLNQIVGKLPEGVQVEFWLYQDRKGFVEKRILKHAHKKGLAAS